jgi:hypothetical protein
MKCFLNAAHDGGRRKLALGLIRPEQPTVRVEVEAESKPAPESRHFAGGRDVTRLHGGVAQREGRVDAIEPRALVWAERAGNTRLAGRQRGVARPQVDAQVDV